MAVQELDLDKLVADVRSLAEGYPNAVYEKPGDVEICLYDRGEVDGGPECEGCIIGQAARCQPKAFEAVFSGEWGQISEVLERLGIAEPEDPRVQWLVSVQEYQDDHRPWGYAIKQTDSLGLL